MVPKTFLVSKDFWFKKNSVGSNEKIQADHLRTKSCYYYYYEYYFWIKDNLRLHLEENHQFVLSLSDKTLEGFPFSGIISEQQRIGDSEELEKIPKK